MKASLLTTLMMAGAGAWALFMPVASVFAQFETPVVRFTVDRFVVEGENPLSKNETAAVLKEYTGEHAGVDGLLAAADALEDAIRKKGLSFHRVVLQPQQLKSRVVVLKVVVFQISKVEIRGNKYFSDTNVRRSVPGLAEGRVPNTRTIARGIALANQNPSKNVTLTFRESDSVPNSMEGHVEVKDSKPWQIFAGLNNTGTAPTGPLRLTVGGFYSNVFDRDHVASLSYTTSPGHASQVKQVGANYYAPIYRYGGGVSAYYVSSDVSTGRILDTFDVAGKGEFAGIRYTHAFLRRGGFTHSMTLGIDDKLFDNDVIAAGSNFAQDVRSRPVSLQYAGAYESELWRSSFKIEYARNTASGGGNNDFAYQANRFQADPHWDVWRVGIDASSPLKGGWMLRGVVDAQLAHEELIPGEQFGIGGAQSVRGFDEREVAGDDGIRTSLEVWAPPIINNVRLLGFFDTGRVHLKTATPGVRNTDGLVSAGIGIRWQWKTWVSFSLDVAHVFEGTPARPDGVRGHFNILARY